MKAWHTFQRAMAQVRDGLQQSEVLALLGAPDVVYDRDAEAGIDFSWGYHERLPNHRDFSVLTTCRHFLQHLDAMRNRADDKTETFHRAARFARQTDHQRLVHDRGEIAREDGVLCDFHRFQPHG